jgi:long-chain acyl-CoA synthetase
MSLNSQAIQASINTKFPLQGIHGATPVPGTEKEGHTLIYRNSAIKDELLSAIHPQLDNLETLFQHAVNLYGNMNCLGYRICSPGSLDSHYTFYTYNQIKERRDNLAAGILHLVKDEDAIVSIYAENRYEWVLTDLATSSVSLPNTALYDTLGPEASKYILELTRSPILFLSGGMISKILDLKRSFLPDLAILISFDPFTPELVEEASYLGIRLLGLGEIEQIGASNKPVSLQRPTSETIHTICFTSGTTGPPKGVLIKHKNTVAFTVFVTCLRERLNSHYNRNHGLMDYNLDDEGEQIRHLCSLPLAHIYERSSTTYYINNGISVAFPSNGMLSLIDDWRALRPHHVGSVPRVWNRIETVVKNLLDGYDLDSLNEVDTLLLQNKVRDTLGLNKIRDCVTGSAPLSKDTIEFLSKWICVGFGQGYGTTETLAGICTMDPFHAGGIFNSVGPIGTTCEVRLKDVPSLNYLTTDKPWPRGELLVRGNQIFDGYYKRPDLTKDSFDEDGFFQTGDVVTFDPAGNMYIIDRVKNFFKLAQGEFVAPEKIENAYLANCRIIQQIFVHGDSLKNYLVAVVGVEPEVFQFFLREHGITAELGEIGKYFKDRKVKTHFVEKINSQVKGLQGFEKVHNVDLSVVPLAGDVLTPTLKLKRDVARVEFKSVIRSLYREGSHYRLSRV